MKKSILLFALSFLSIFLSAQTFLIDPSGDGGFENGSTLAANGWTVVDASAVTWFVGAAAGTQGGTNAAFVGSNATTYSGSTSAVYKHFYRDIAIPAGATQVYLNYYLKMPIIDNTYDYLYIYTSTTAQTPVSGSIPIGNQQVAYTTPALAGFSARPQIDLTSLAGTTVRLIFTYKTDAASPYANPAVDNISLTCSLPAPAGPVFSNTSANSIPVYFDNIRAVSTPVFAISSTGMAYNSMQVEANTKDDFSGTTYTQSFNGTYSSAVKYDYVCNNLSPVLPATDPAVYYVRARASSDGGATWGAWSTQRWSFTHSASDYGWHQTAKAQFSEGTFSGNFIQTTLNGTLGDNVYMNRGAFTEYVIANADDGVWENGTWYPSSTYSTIGYQDDCNGPSNIYNAFRFSNVSIPRNSNILSANMQLYASGDCVCESQSSNIYTKIAGHSHGAADAPALTSAIATTTTNRSATNVLWLQSTAWINNTQYNSPDIKTVIADMTSQATWDEEEHMNIFIDSYSTATYKANRCINNYDYSAGARKPAITGTFTDFENSLRSPMIDFASFTCSPSYSELKWTKDQTFGTVKVQLYYDNAGTPTIIPDGALPGNSTGLTSPVNLSALNTTTYGKLYIFATLRYTSVNASESPLLSDWSITSVPVASVNAGINQSICVAANATLTATGCGVFTWSTGESTSSITVSPGSTTTYTVTATVGNGNSATDAVQVTVNPSPSIDTQPLPQSACNGGSVTFSTTAVGGGLTYQWQEYAGSIWSNISNVGIYSGATSNTLTVNPAASSMNGYQYQCVVSGACPPSATTNSVLLTVNPLPTAFNVTGTGSYCAGGTGVAIGLSGSQSGVTYQLQLNAVNSGSSVAGTGSAISFGSQTTAGTYTVIATNTTTLCVNNMTGNAVVTVNPLPGLYTVTGGGSYCTGGSGLAVGLSGSQSGVNYQLQLNSVNSGSPIPGNGGAISFGSQTSAGLYTVIATNAATFCNSTMTGSVSITINSNPIADAGTGVSICSGSSTQLVASGGISYSWNPSATLSDASISNPFANPTINTTYTVTVTNADGCSATDDVTITVNPSITVDAGSDVVICSGNNTNLNTSGGISYSWSPTATLSNPLIANPIASPTTTTTYTVTVTNSSGCTGTDDVTVTVNPTPSANAGNDISICYGASTQLNATGGDTYSWDPSTSLNNPSIYNPVASPTATITYTVQVSNSFGCSSTDQIIVSVYPQLNVNAGNDVDVCAGSAVNLSVTGGVSHSWLPISGLSNPTIANPSASPSATTLYTVSVTDNNGCSSTDDVLVLVNPVPAANAGGDISTCLGIPVNLSASGGVSYSWTPTGSLSASDISNPLANPNTTTTYTVVVTDINGCSDSDDIVLTITSLTVASAGSDTSFCDGNYVMLNATGGTSYSWSPATGLSSVTISNPTASPSVTTNYTVTVTDNNGCSGTDQVLITVNPVPSVALSTNSFDNIAYIGNNVVLTATPSTFNSYQFYVGNFSNLVQSGSNYTYQTNALIGPQVIYVIAGENGCFSIVDSVSIDFKPISNAFTPNNDGVNDKFLKGLDLKILNRWGELLYEGTNGWDGKYKNNDVSEGTYYFIVYLSDENNDLTEVKGSVTITRNKQ